MGEFYAFYNADYKIRQGRGAFFRFSGGGMRCKMWLQKDMDFFISCFFET